MLILAIDPGPVKSAILEWDGKTIKFAHIDYNDMLRRADLQVSKAEVLVIEQVKSYGMAVSDLIFDTVFWTGRFCERWPRTWVRLPRMDVKMHLCHNSRAKDSNIRQALVDRFGPPGTKKSPGVTFGLSKDLWAAFAVAVTYYDGNEGKNEQKTI